MHELFWDETLSAFGSDGCGNEFNSSILLLVFAGMLLLVSSSLIVYGKAHLLEFAVW